MVQVILKLTVLKQLVWRPSTKRMHQTQHPEMWDPQGGSQGSSRMTMRRLEYRHQVSEQFAASIFSILKKGP